MKAEELPSEEDWNEWMQHPVTKLLRAWAAERQQALKDLWATGGFSASFEMEMLVKNAAATGACSAYAEVQELDFTDIIGVMSDAK